MTISARIGIADKCPLPEEEQAHGGVAADPRQVRARLAARRHGGNLVSDPGAKLEALHLFTFNQVQATVDWQQRMLAALDDA